MFGAMIRVMPGPSPDELEALPAIVEEQLLTDTYAQRGARVTRVTMGENRTSVFRSWWAWFKMVSRASACLSTP